MLSNTVLSRAATWGASLLVGAAIAVASTGAPAHAAGSTTTVLPFNTCGNVCQQGGTVAENVVSPVRNRSPKPSIIPSRRPAGSSPRWTTR